MSNSAKIILSTTLGISITLLCGCVSPVYTDYDREAVHRFDQYNCFEIVSGENQENNEDIVLGPIVNRRIERKLDDVLKMYGFTDQCSSPDFRVQWHTAKKTVKRLSNFGSVAFHEHRYGYSTFGPYPSFHMDQYEEGTFLVDIIDAQSNEIVWRGAYRKRLGFQAPTDAEVRSMLTEILERFPPAVVVDPD